jgi:hypothetical protein
MGNAITQESRAVWLAMRNQGGWWSVKALLHFWQPTFAQFEIEELVKGLKAGRYVMAREVNPGEISYAVTSDCLVLPGEEQPDGDFGRRA